MVDKYKMNPEGDYKLQFTSNSLQPAKAARRNMDFQDMEHAHYLLKTAVE
jgi:hypothetical protein